MAKIVVRNESFINLINLLMNFDDCRFILINKMDFETTKEGLNSTNAIGHFSMVEVSNFII